MRKKRGLSALALGTLLCAIVPAAAYAQDKLERDVASQPGIEVRLLGLLPEGPGPALPDLVERSNRTEVVVTLTGAPPDLVSPGLSAEIHEGTCQALKSAPVPTANETPGGGYPLTPSVFSLGSFGAILPVSFPTLLSSAHTITVRIGGESRNAAFACVDIA